MAHVVTGEAVALELRVAHLPSRALGRAIDVVVQLGALTVLAFLLGAVGAVADEALAAGAAIVVVVAVFLGYPVLMETLTGGRTLGKMALGLRVVRDDGGPIRFRHAFVRGLLGVVEIYVTLGVVPVLVSILNRHGKRVGDLAAGTVVVRDRVPVRRAAAPAMPYGLEGWAAQLQLAALPDDLALAARDYLARCEELSPEARWSMGVRLAESVAAVVSPPPPRGLPPEHYLAAVLAERRRRALTAAAPGYGGAQPAYGQQPRYGGQPGYGRPTYGHPGYGPQPTDGEPARPTAPPAPEGSGAHSAPAEAPAPADPDRARGSGPDNPFTPPS